LSDEIGVLKVQAEVFKEDYTTERLQRASLAGELESLRTAHEASSKHNNRGGYNKYQYAANDADHTWPH